MSLSKSETDIAILQSASITDKSTGELDVVMYERNTDSVHPRDCLCEVCKALKHKDSGVTEKNVKENLGYYVGDSHQ